MSNTITVSLPRAAALEVLNQADLRLRAASVRWEEAKDRPMERHLAYLDASCDKETNKIAQKHFSRWERCRLSLLGSGLIFLGVSIDLAIQALVTGFSERLPVLLTFWGGCSLIFLLSLPGARSLPYTSLANALYYHRSNPLYRLHHVLSDWKGGVTMPSELADLAECMATMTERHLDAFLLRVRDELGAEDVRNLDRFAVTLDDLNDEFRRVGFGAVILEGDDREFLSRLRDCYAHKRAVAVPRMTVHHTA